MSGTCLSNKSTSRRIYSTATIRVCFCYSSIIKNKTLIVTLKGKVVDTAAVTATTAAVNATAAVNGTAAVNASTLPQPRYEMVLKCTIELKCSAVCVYHGNTRDRYCVGCYNVLHNFNFIIIVLLLLFMIWWVIIFLQNIQIHFTIVHNQVKLDRISCKFSENC